MLNNNFDTELQAFLATLGEGEEKEYPPDTPPNYRAVFFLLTTWDKFSQVVSQVFFQSQSFKGSDYYYSINASAGKITLSWWGAIPHQKLSEKESQILSFLNRVKDIFWEDITASQIRAEYQARAGQIIARAEEPLLALLNFYQDKIPFQLLKYLKENMINISDYNPETKTLTLSLSDADKGHLIGKQGVKIKEFEQSTGYKLILS